MSIKFENVITPFPEQWRSIILGARNAMNSWKKSDSRYIAPRGGVPAPVIFQIGQNDHDLMMRLIKNSNRYRKYITKI